MLMTEPSPPASPAFVMSAATVRQLSPLMLSDRLIGLAQDADRAGLRGPASALVLLACAVLDAPKAARKRA